MHALFFAIVIVAVSGCSSKKAYQEDKTNESVQVDSTKDSGEIIEMDEKSAQQLVEERLDTTKYSVEKAEDATVDDVNYYIFNILEGDKQLSMGVAVDKISGELYAYKEDKTIAPYSEFTLYDESTDEETEWEGSYKSETVTLDLMPADSNSFEFTFANENNTDSLTGVAQVSGKEAKYEDEDGFKLSFVKEGNTITVTESESGDDSFAFGGTYTQ